MRVAAYLRVSTSDQSVDNQLPAIEQLVKDRGWELAEVYAEHESAWRSGHQYELKHLLDDLRSGKHKYDYVVVWSLDRLTREGIAKIFDLMHSFKTCGCQVISVKEPWTETSGIMTDLLYAVSAWVAEFESSRRSERIQAGIKRKTEREGYRPGRQKGAKDRGKRDRTGYLLRYAKKKRTPVGASK
ncbi:MAG: recombinase family protein [Dehalococcoidia bacterium]|nr:recombinase family protein [Dehalococcoidia bacterium]